MEVDLIISCTLKLRLTYFNFRNMELGTSKESNDFNLNFDYVKKLEETYIVKLIGGRHTSKGSFWAVNELGDEFFIGPGLVKTNPEIIDTLKKEEKTYWALIQKVVWGGKWNDQEVEEVMMLASEKDSCESFKSDLKSEYELCIKKYEKFELLLEYIKNMRNNIEIKKLEIEIQQLDEKIECINKKLNLHKGWLNIHC